MVDILIGLDKILEHIKNEADAECDEISRKASNKREQIRKDYAHLEQDEYWKYINSGTKETELRQEQLKNLAAMEAKKKLLATQQEMVDAAFALAADKLRELPKSDYTALCKRLNTKASATPEEIVERYRGELSQVVLSALFD
ncbi:MAG: V-type ATP synthase subunit E [Oscillospiraceae bacterium]|nr:V-type ATP synthase subunit E [Oscillospiraceae bacterium]